MFPRGVHAPYSGENSSSACIVIRSDLDPRSLASAVRIQFATVDPSQPVFDITAMKQRIEDSIEIPPFNMTILAIFASIAMVLSTVGLDGVISYFVSQRTHEIGILDGSWRSPFRRSSPGP
jgi:hypothetical protein